MHNAIVDRATSKLLAAAIALTLLPGPASAVVSAPRAAQSRPHGHEQAAADPGWLPVGRASL